MQGKSQERALIAKKRVNFNQIAVFFPISLQKAYSFYQYMMMSLKTGKFLSSCKLESYRRLFVCVPITRGFVHIECLR